MPSTCPKIDRPTVGGRYWYRAPDGAWEVVLVYERGPHRKLLIAWIGVSASPFASVDIAPGEWRGPIPPPNAEAEESIAQPPKPRLYWDRAELLRETVPPEMLAAALKADPDDGG